MSKQSEIREILRQHHGDRLQAPNQKQLANYQAHLATNDAEYKDFVALLGMYAGYYVIQTNHNSETTIVATRLHLKFYTLPGSRRIEGTWDFELDGTTYQKGSHTRFLFAKNVEGIINAILNQLAYNAASRSRNQGIWQVRLPAHLRKQYNPNL